MELIYVWIEDYKNIKKTGFSLNLKYDITYNQDNNTIFCNPTNNYNVFNKNNFMTIIGQNGSGKSTLIKTIKYILKDNSSPDNNDFAVYKYAPKCFILLKNDDEYIYKSNIKNLNNITLKIDGDVYVLKNSEDFSLNTALFQPFLEKEDDEILEFPIDYHNDVIISKKLKNYFYYDRFRTYEITHGLDYVFKITEIKLFKENPHLIFHKYGYEIDIEFMFKWINRQLERTIKQYYVPKDWTHGQLFNFLNSLLDGNDILQSKWAKTDKTIENFFNMIFPRFCALYFFIQIGILYYEIYHQDREQDTNRILNIDSLTEISDTLSELNNCLDKTILPEIRDSLKKAYKKCRNELKKSSDNFNANFDLASSIINLLDLYIEIEDKRYKILDELNEYLVIEKNLNTIRLKTSKMLSLNESIPTQSIIDKLKNTGIFRLNFYKLETADSQKDDKEWYNFFDLSTGEQRILKLFADIAQLYKQYNVNIYIFDEPDLSWHPEWQRKMVYYINDFFEKLEVKKSLNIIFTTHSPFILSDMPKDNVIMLCRGDDGYAKKYNNEENTFGANIHDLFKNNFFFSGCDGICTIGEFAKNYIKNIQKTLNSYETIFYDEIFYSPCAKTKDFDIKKEIQKIDKQIQIIGEPIIKNSLLKELYSSPFALQHFPDDVLANYIKLKQTNKELKETLKELEQENQRLQRKLNEED